MTAATSLRSLVELGLLLDHRGDRHHVVGGQVLRAGVAHVDALDPPLEVFELQLDEVGGRGALLQLEGVGEEEALEVLRLGAAVLGRVEVGEPTLAFT